MATADTAKLIASLELKDLFSKSLKNAEKNLGSFDKKLDHTQGRAYLAGQQIGTGIKRGAVLAVGGISFLVANIGLGLKSLTELESITTQTNAVLKSTSGVAGQTADSIRKLAEKYEGLNATIDDKVIQSAENVLLTFTNIRKDAFEPTLAAALDLSTAMGQDLQSSIVQIGKALNDPTKGLTALQRVGVAFTKDQVKQIKALNDSGHAMEAQKLILAELNKEFGGSFIAGGTTTAGKVAKFKDAIEDLQKTLATALLPVIGKVADGLSKFLSDPAVIRGANDLGTAIAGLFSDKNLAAGADFLKGALQTVRDVAPIVAQAAKVTFGFVQSAVSLFKSLPKELQGLIVGGLAVNKLTGGLVTNIAGGLIESVIKRMSAALVNVNGAVVNVTGGAAAAGSALGGAAPVAGGASKISKLASAATKVFLIGAAAGAFLELKGIFDEQSQRNKVQEADLTKQNQGFVKVAGITDLQTALAGIEAQEKHLENTWDAQGFAFRLNIDGVKDAVHQQEQTLRDEIKRLGGGNAFFGITTPITKAFTASLAALGVGKSAKTGKDDIVNLVQLQRGTLALLSDQFKQMLAALKGAKKPEDIKAAVKAAIETVIGKGRGDVDSTRTLLADLKKKLGQTDDPKTRAVLKDAIAKVQAKIPGREFAQAQIRKADAILKKNESTDRKIGDLKEIEKSLKDRGLPHAADEVKKRIDQAKKEQVAASRATTESIKDKDMSPHLAVTVPITNRLTFNSREILQSSVSFGRAFATASGAPKPS